MTKPKPPAAPVARPIFHVEAWPLAQVHPYPDNPRRNDRAITKVTASLREFGWRQPIVVDPAGVIVVGHTRYEAAKRLRMTLVPVHVARDLTPEQLRAYRLADNRLGEEADWDEVLLRSEVQALAAGFDLLMAGFDREELQALLVTDTTAAGSIDAAPAEPTNPTTKPGDVIQLGPHLLVCGDATVPETWALLGPEVAQKGADAIWTDPPYAVNVTERVKALNRADRRAGKPGKRVETGISNDALDPAELGRFLRRALGLALEHTRPGGAWYVACPPGPLFFEFGLVLRELNVWRHTLTWVKDGHVMGRADYHYRHEAILYGWRAIADDRTPSWPLAEPIAYGWRDDAGHTWYGDRSQDTVLEYPRPKSSKLHPTMKPVHLIERCLANSTKRGDLVLDPFAGSGSTLMACELLGRRAGLLELSPGYCDVIVGRWERETGQKAVRPA